MGGQSTGINVPVSLMRREDVQEALDYDARPAPAGSMEGALGLLRGEAEVPFHGAGARS